MTVEDTIRLANKEAHKGNHVYIVCNPTDYPIIQRRLSHDSIAVCPIMLADNLNFPPSMDITLEKDLPLLAPSQSPII